MMTPRPGNDSLLCTVRPGAGGVPIYLIPSAGTTPLSFLHLARALESRRTIHSFTFAGIDNDHLPPTTIEATATAFVDEIRRVQPRGPYALGGHCFGGTVAFEMTQQLARIEEQVELLVLLDTFVPTRNRESNPTSAQVRGHVKKALDLVYEESSKRLALLPPAAAEPYSRILQMQIDAALGYEGQPVATRAVLFRTQTHDELAFEGWQAFATTGFREIDVDGETFSMLRPPHIAGLARHLDRELADSE